MDKKDVNSSMYDPVGDISINASMVRIPFLAAAMLNSAVALSLNQMAGEFLKKAFQPIYLKSKVKENKFHQKEETDILKHQNSKNLQYEKRIEHIDMKTSHLLKRDYLATLQLEPTVSTNEVNGNSVSEQIAIPKNFLSEIIASHSTLPSVLSYANIVSHFKRPRSDKKKGGRKVEYICKFPGCRRSFRCKDFLQNHFRIHTGEKPFKCDNPHCELSFARKSTLYTHRMTHLERQERRKFTCPHPGCEKNFVKKTNLEDHMNLHSGVRPYACEVVDCGKAFRCRSSLCVHRRAHMQQSVAAKFINSFLETADQI